MKKGVLEIALFFGIILILAAAWIYFSNQEKESSLSDAQVANVAQINKADNKNPPKDDTEDWKIYSDTRYGFEIKYPEEILLLADSEEYYYGIFLKSQSVTSIEASDVYDMHVSVENIKESAYSDAKNEVVNANAAVTVEGPEKRQINGMEVFVITSKLYDGGEGISRSYYFPNLVITFSYANDRNEGNLEYVEREMIPTLKFLERR